MHTLIFYAEVGKKTRRKQKDTPFVSLCVSVSLLLNIEFLPWVFCPTHYTSSDWSSKSEPELPERYPLPRSGCGKKRWWFTASSHLPLMYPLSQHPWGSIGFCWWVKPAWAMKKPHKICTGHVCRCAGQQTCLSATSINSRTARLQLSVAAAAHAGRPKFSPAAPSSLCKGEKAEKSR